MSLDPGRPDLGYPERVKHTVVAIASICALLTGCPRQPPPPEFDDASLGDGATLDGGMPDDTGMPVDAPGLDAFVDDAAPAGDAGVDAAFWDSGVMPGMTVAAPPTDIVRVGTGGFLLRGTVLAPSGPISPGEVLIVGDTIVCVAADCTSDPRAAAVTILDTHATIAPGLIDAHNHGSYNFLPEWTPDPAHLFGNRYEWRGDPAYSAHVQPESKLEAWGTGDPRNGQHMCAALRWGELRSLVHGTTTMQGESPNRTCIHGLVRNADHSHGLGTNHMRTTISGACETTLNDAARVSLVTAFRSGAATRHAVHMAEGYTGGGTATDPTRELDCYAGRYRATTSLLTDTDGTPFGAALFIHSVPFTEANLVESMAGGAHFVWSPSSNIILYGRTAPIGRMLQLGLPVALGPDWTVSGSDEMLSEMRFALDWAATEAVPEVTPEALVTMATRGGAEAVDLAASIGSLTPGLRADVVVFGRIGTDPYSAVTDSRSRDVRLVLIDGAGYYGDLALEATTAVNGMCEMFDACGAPKFLCAAGATEVATSGAETYDELEMFLRNYLETGWLEDPDGSGPLPVSIPHAFALSGADLLPLVDCSL